MSIPLDIDIEALERDLHELRDELREDLSYDDYLHLRKMLRWSNACTAAGYATAWIAPNPVSALLIGVGNFSRWLPVAHHILHGAYDKIPGVPERFTSKQFGRGRRRWIDWVDWFEPEAWAKRHNFIHHYRVGELADPDHFEHSNELIRDERVPVALGYVALAVTASTWRFSFYGPLLQFWERDMEDLELGDPWYFTPKVWNPLAHPGQDVWLRSWLPNAAVQFGLIPMLFAPLGPWAVFSVACNRVGAEVVTNVQAFALTMVSHAGDDIYRFDEPLEDRRDFYLRQIVGTVDMPPGGDLWDFLHGYMNYQVVHHLWPNMTMLQLRKAAPRIKEICERHGVPYVREPLRRRLKKLVDIGVGRTSMKRWPRRSAEVPVTAAAAAAE